MHAWTVGHFHNLIEIESILGDFPAVPIVLMSHVTCYVLNVIGYVTINSARDKFCLG